MRLARDFQTEPGRLAGAPVVEPSEIAECRGYLLRFARFMLDPASAEDAVHDAIVAALSAHRSYGGKSSLRTWLVGILKHKVADVLRRRLREVSPSPRDAGALELMAAGRQDGFQITPADWSEAKVPFTERRFLEVLQDSINRLPAIQARVFTMKELLCTDTGEICAELGITRNHYFVLLHRARTSLRDELGQHW